MGGVLPEWAESGVHLWAWVGGDRWVGDAGPLSPDDRDRFKDVRLRLVWSNEACFVILRKRDDFFLLHDKEIQLKPIQNQV